MLKSIYKRYPYFFNLLIVLVILSINRTLDWFAWTPPYPEKTKDILLSQLFEFVAFLLFLFLLLFCYKWAIRKKPPILFISLILVFGIIGPTLIKLLKSWFVNIFWRRDLETFSMDLIEKFTPTAFTVILFLSAAYYLTHLRLQYSKQRETAHRAETLAKEVQLKMLRYQINPHFLFNVLNSIHALIDENASKAKKLVVEMSEYYRYTLNKQKQSISIENEVEAIVKYLEIQKIRFEEKFEYVINVDEALKTVLIPSFVIHLLIENAVKYGIMSNEKKLIIQLSAKLTDKQILITVSNTGKLMDTTAHSKNSFEGTGSGIENIKNRLSLFYNDRYSFSLTENNGWVIASIEIENMQL